MGKNRKPMKTTLEEAIDYWVKYQDESGLSVDWAEAKERCWRCGCERNLQRCYIVPHALGGKDEPSNIVLLCERCHADGPNVVDPEICGTGFGATASLFMILSGPSRVCGNIVISMATGSWMIFRKL